MNFIYNKFGPIKNAEIELADLTVITGNNNQGKTYISYSVYGFMNNWQSYTDELIYRSDEADDYSFEINSTLSLKDIMEKEQSAKIWSSVSEQFSKSLNNLFSAEKTFDGASVQMNETNPSKYNELIQKPIRIINQNNKLGTISVEKDSGSDTIRISQSGKSGLAKWFNDQAINNAIFKEIFGKEIYEPFVVTSERTGISLFYKELDISKNMLIEEIGSNSKFNPFDFVAKSTSRYAIPIHHNINYIRDMGEMKKLVSPLMQDEACIKSVVEFWDKIVGGKYVIDSNNISYKKKGIKGSIPLYISSSTTKSLLSLDLFIRHFAKPGNILIIDEPELNLHPDNQVMMARLFARMVNAGIKVFITTHSDYLVYELSNLVMANGIASDKDLLHEVGYEDCDLLDPAKLKVYNAMKGGVKQSPIDKWGIDAKTFATVTNELSKRSSLLSTHLE